MQVFSEPELTQQQQQHHHQQQLNSSNNTSSSLASHQNQHHHVMQQQEQALVLGLDRRDSYPELSQGGGDNTYATIQPRNYASNLSSVLMGTSGIGGGGGGGSGNGAAPAGGLSGEMSDYATLRNSRAPSVSVVGGRGFVRVPRRRNFSEKRVSVIRSVVEHILYDGGWVVWLLELMIFCNRSGRTCFIIGQLYLNLLLIGWEESSVIGFMPNSQNKMFSWF